jgi:argininosuccinate synthase
MAKDVKKIVLAYSGGLDTSVILKWLQITYPASEIYTYTADLGQGEDVDLARQKALKTGAKEAFVLDLQEEFVRDYVFPMFHANAIYEGEYLLGTSIARPITAKYQIEIAKQLGADAVSHGATGKGNDQVRFELAYYTLKPDVHVIAPWREWNLNSRTKLIEFAKKYEIEVPKGKENEPPYSMDANLLHLSIEGKALEDPNIEAQDDTYFRVKPLSQTPNEPETVEVEFEKGDPVAVNGTRLSPAKLLTYLNNLGGKHGIGRIDLVENRFVGMKSRGIYETPGGTILLKIRRALESLVLDKGEAHLKDELMPKYAELIYNGFWFSGERKMLQAAIDATQNKVCGMVRFKLFKGNIIICGRTSPYTLYNQNISTFEADDVYNQRDAEGFIKLNALRFRLNTHE